jgi:hypothetical protein
MLAVAQIFAVLQGIGALAIGTYIFWELVANHLASSLGGPAALNGFLFNFIFPYAVAILVVGLVMVVAGVRVGRASQIARWLLAAWEIVAFFTLLALVTGNGVWLGSLSVVALSSSGVGFVSPYLVLGVEAAVIYGLAVDPATYRAFAR